MSNIISNEDNRYSLGIQKMDNTHEEFINLVNRLATATKAEFATLFDELVTHTEIHFESEKEFMEKSGFPATDEHIGEHMRVLRDLKSLNSSAQRGITAMARSFIRDQVPEWFHLHATTMDAALAKHLKTEELKIL